MKQSQIFFLWKEYWRSSVKMRACPKILEEIPEGKPRNAQKRKKNIYRLPVFASLLVTESLNRQKLKPVQPSLRTFQDSCIHVYFLLSFSTFTGGCLEEKLPARRRSFSWKGEVKVAVR
jgi:hypothetical protein